MYIRLRRSLEGGKLRLEGESGLSYNDTRQERLRLISLGWKGGGGRLRYNHTSREGRKALKSRLRSMLVAITPPQYRL